MPGWRESFSFFEPMRREPAVPDDSGQIAPDTCQSRQGMAAAWRRSRSSRDLDAHAIPAANRFTLMQALRRSIKGDKDKMPQVAIGPKSAVAIVPPKKVSTDILRARHRCHILHKCTNPRHCRLSARYTITRRSKAKSSAFREATSSTLSGARTTLIGTKPATQLCPMHAVSYQ